MMINKKKSSYIFPNSSFNNLRKETFHTLIFVLLTMKHSNTFCYILKNFWIFYLIIFTTEYSQFSLITSYLYEYNFLYYLDLVQSNFSYSIFKAKLKSERF